MAVDRRPSVPFPEQNAGKKYLYVLSAVNFLLMLASLALTGMGIYGILEAEQLENQLELLTDMPIEEVAVCICILGGLGSVACLAGFKGASTNNEKLRRFLLSLYLFVLFTVMLIQICMCVFLIMYGTEEVLDDLVKDRWFEEGPQALQRRIDYQDFFSCCGWESIYDSRASGYNTPCPISDPDPCREATIDYLHSFFFPLAIFGLTLAGLELIAIIATVAVLQAKKKVFDDWEGF